MTCSNSDGSEWSLHAQLVLKHGGHAGPDENGAVHMEYSWSPAPRNPDSKPLYAFRRGDLIFTAAPPTCGINRLQQQPPSAHTLPRTARPATQLSCSPVCVADVPPTGIRTSQPYERRCQSSCSITLSCDEKPVNRTQSFNNQENTNKKTNRAHTFTTRFCTQVLNEKQNRDASSQTQPCPSPVANITPMPSDPLTARISAYKSAKREPSKSPAAVNGRGSGRSKSFTQGKQPRTVHIDVYCTGSEDADDSGSSGSEVYNKAKTVYEGQDVRIQHRRATSRELPLRRRRTVRRVVNRANTVHLPDSPVINISETLDSLLSINTSQSESLSSFSTNNPSVASSLDASADTVASSWKETDIECQRLSALSIGTSSMQNDSFEYADSSDRQRILKMAERWQCVGDSFESRIENHKNLYQKRSMENSTDSLDDDDDDGSEMGWTFSLEGEVNSRKADPSVKSDSTPPTVYRVARRSILGTISPRPAKLEDARIKPFTNEVQKTECFARAEKFGVIVNSLKKPGHHVGPAKNPDCSCFTCIKYFEENRSRGRTRSVGDLPKTVNIPARSRLSSCDRDTVCSQFSYIKDLV